MRGREKKSMLELITVNSQEFGKAAVVMDLFALSSSSSSSSLFPIIWEADLLSVEREEQMRFLLFGGRRHRNKYLPMPHTNTHICIIDFLNKFGKIWVSQKVGLFLSFFVPPPPRWAVLNVPMSVLRSFPPHPKKRSRWHPPQNRWYHLSNPG